jgi:hypothetical protein
MAHLLVLWLPILVSAVAIFFLSSLVHMVIPWHKSDYDRFPDESAALDALRALNLPAGEYMAPRPESREGMSSPEFKAKVERGPLVLLNIRPGGPISMGGPLGWWFVYLVVTSFFSGHVAWGAFHDHFETAGVFHTVALSAFLAYTAALWQGVIWFRRPASVAFKSTIDGLIYALVTAWIFVWLWPK